LVCSQFGAKSTKKLGVWAKKLLNICKSLTLFNPSRKKYSRFIRVSFTLIRVNIKKATRTTWTTFSSYSLHKGKGNPFQMGSSCKLRIILSFSAPQTNFRRFRPRNLSRCLTLIIFLFLYKKFFHSTQKSYTFPLVCAAFRLERPSFFVQIPAHIIRFVQY